MNETNYSLLADVMRRASRFCKLNRNACLVLDVILDHSFRIGQPVARFRSQEALLLLTTLTKNRVSEALNYLVACRICSREQPAKDPLMLMPLPDWWGWSAPAASQRYLDRSFVASLVGYCVIKREDVWVAEPVPRVHPVVQAALEYARGENTERPSPDEAGIAREDAISGLAPSARRRGRPPRVVPPEEIAAENEACAAAVRATSEENQGYAVRLFPEWEARRREPYIEALIADWGNAVVFRALQHAQESRKPIKRPWGFLKMLCRDLGKPKPPRSA
jgi:hypothetical protein